MSRGDEEHQGTKTRNTSDRYATNEKMTKDIKKAEYDPKKFGCKIPDFMVHDMEWKFAANGVLKGRCKICGETAEI